MQGLNEEKYQRLLKKLKNEVGEIILTALEDERVIEIMLNSDGNLWIERLGEDMILAGKMSAVNALSMMSTIADSLDVVVNKENPILEGELILDGSRFEGLIPPIVSSPSFSIRKKAKLIFTLEDYQKLGTITASQKSYIEDSVKNKKNILIVGGTGSGKTTLTNAVIESINQLTPKDRLIIIEDTAEIQSSAKNTLILRTSYNISMLNLLRASMRLRPDRILVGEVRGAEALALLKSWNTGHPGGVATLHANDARAGLIRLEQLIAESGTNMKMQTLIAEAVDLIISIEKNGGKRQIKELLEVKSFTNNSYDVNYIK